MTRQPKRLKPGRPSARGKPGPKGARFQIILDEELRERMAAAHARLGGNLSDVVRSTLLQHLPS